MQILWLVVVCAVTSTLADEFHPKMPAVSPRNARVLEDADYWNSVARAEMQDSLALERNTGVAKNVIMFIGDGMSLDTITAGRILQGQEAGSTGEENLLAFEHFPFTGLSKTYNVDRQVPDSAGTATAYLCGVKTDMGVVGVDATVERGDCTTVNEANKVDSIAAWFQAQNKRTGIVTSTRVTHATPSGAYAHTADRDWECDEEISEDMSSDCPEFKDIARQLIEDPTGSAFNVIMGGGLKHFDGNVTDMPYDNVSGCVRQDGRILWQDWLDGKDDSAQFVKSLSQLNDVNLNETNYLLGLFANSHMPYEYEKREGELDLPTLSQMTEAAIRVLLNDDSGFFLLVEGGKIDLGHHAGKAHVALDELLSLSDAVATTLEMVDLSETLIVLTADHAHTMTISGYPERGNSILGVAGTATDLKGYTSLSYATGPGYVLTAIRPDPSEQDTSDFEYKQQATVPKSTETHGGDDVPIYATGPMAHLFTGVHEQNFIAHAMAYAACVGADQSHCD